MCIVQGGEEEEEAGVGRTGPCPGRVLAPSPHPHPEVGYLLHLQNKVSVADPDPGSGAFFTSGSGMNNQDHISASLEKFFWVNILKLFDAGSYFRELRNKFLRENT